MAGGREAGEGLRGLGLAEAEVLGVMSQSQALEAEALPGEELAEEGEVEATEGEAAGWGAVLDGAGGCMHSPRDGDAARVGVSW